MSEIKIRKFTHTDVEAYIRLTQSSFANEWIAGGMTLDAFASQTRKIFRWKMIPYRLLTTLMGIQWEAFVAEKDGYVVGGGMYMGRRNRLVLTNLMVEPEYRRQGIGQALLVKRLERLAERKIPFVTVQVLETNKASLGNLRKQGFEEFYRRSVYERPLPFSNSAKLPELTSREMRPSDKTLFRQFEQKTMDPFVLYNQGAEADYFPSFWQKFYARYAGSQRYIKAFDLHDKTIGFLEAGYHTQQTKGYISQPVMAEECLPHLETMLHKAGDWLGQAGKQSVRIECSEYLPQLGQFLIDSGWSKLHTWISLVKWLDPDAKDKMFQ